MVVTKPSSERANCTWWRMASLQSPLSSFSVGFQLLSVVALCLWLLEGVDAQSRRDEVRILLTFKEASILDYEGLYNLEELYWINWSESDENACAWTGVTCTKNFTVQELDFSDWGFPDISAVGILSNLKDLSQLDLSSNQLIFLPDDIGTLTGLTRLDFSRNSFGGQIPGSISGCQNLRFLSFEDNFFYGEIGNLSTLVNLQFLYLAHNNFSGAFPKWLGELSGLVSFDISDNSLSGTIPALPNLINLVSLNLNNNDFTGFEEPWLLGENGALEFFSVSFNQLQGRIPSSIANLRNVTFLDFSHNQLSGDIPSGLSRIQGNYLQLDLSQNYLTGEIPTDVLQSNYSCPSSLNFSHNLLSGSLSMSAYLCFTSVDLSYNNLSGSSSSICISGIQYFGLNNNYLSGDIFDIIQNCNFSDLGELRLENNLFTGDLSRIANITSGRLLDLQILDLSNNNLRWATSQAIPDPITATLQAFLAPTAAAGHSELLNGISELRFGGNNFSGTYLPTTCFVNNSFHNSLEVLDLSNSHLQGEISDVVFNSSCLWSLNFLNLSNNGISGLIPNGIFMLPNLMVLDVSNNSLNGSIPAIPQMSSLNNPSFYEGNEGLCGYPLPSCPQAIPKVIASRGTGVPWWGLLIISMGATTIALGSCLVATWRWRVYQKRHQQDADLIKTLMERDSATLMSLRELKLATNNFTQSAQIGEGGFGTVYAGTLNDGTRVAIKRSKREGSQIDKEQFLNEVRILSHVSHRNLVKLLGCCMENKTALLVFEFVSNGTLQEHLQGKIGVHPLSWGKRLNIAVQIADALNYLHSATMIPIYHRDVKSANILIDEDFNAKVADFGISKLAPIKATHISTIGRGTIGYLDPEYWASFQLTDKSDVYSFGVVLLDLISAKHAVDLQRAEGDASLVIFASHHIKSKDLEELIDPSLTNTYSDPSGQGRESILNVGRLSMKCLHVQSKARPSMNEVLNELQNIWLHLNDTSMQLNSINEDEEKYVIVDPGVLFSKQFSSNTSTFSIQMSESSAPQGFTRYLEGSDKR